MAHPDINAIWGVDYYSHVIAQFIKKNNLQDKKERTKINADDTLKAIFDGKKQVTMFEMNKYVSGHLKA